MDMTLMGVQTIVLLDLAEKSVASFSVIRWIYSGILLKTQLWVQIPVWFHNWQVYRTAGCLPSSVGCKWQGLGTVLPYEVIPPISKLEPICRTGAVTTHQLLRLPGMTECETATEPKLSRPCVSSEDIRAMVRRLKNKNNWKRTANEGKMVARRGAPSHSFWDWRERERKAFIRHYATMENHMEMVTGK